MNLFLGEILPYFGILHISNEVYRNFWFTGLPFFMLGYFIRDKKDLIIPRISNKKILILLLVTFCFTVVEAVNINFITNLQFGSLFLSILLFIWCIKNPNASHFKVIEWIGGNLYAYIYVLHYMLVTVLIRGHIMDFGYLNPVIIFLMTLAIYTVLYVLLNRLPNRASIN